MSVVHKMSRFICLFWGIFLTHIINRVCYEPSWIVSPNHLSPSTLVKVAHCLFSGFASVLDVTDCVSNSFGFVTPVLHYQNPFPFMLKQHISTPSQPRTADDPTGLVSFKPAHKITQCFLSLLFKFGKFHLRIHRRPRGFEKMGWNFLRAPATRQG